MRYYKYNLDYMYTGFEDSETVLNSSTLIEPTSTDHIVWNPTSQLWEKEPVSTLTLTQLQELQVKNVQNYFEDYIEIVKSTLANFEEDTYRTQEDEWRAWTLDNTVPTPYVDILCYRRSIDKITLMNKIGQKVMFFADIQGQMHSLEDAIRATTTEAELELIPMPWDAE